jgi:hypothetical protein
MVVTITSAGVRSKGLRRPVSLSFENSRVRPMEMPTPGRRVSVK